ncbi:MAG: hypothetical protein KAT18_09010 [Candidatus Latescibacteria bacterium]|nr:hypothetical protein [Candidatus Latescibacterota bacterium]
MPSILSWLGVDTEPEEDLSPLQQLGVADPDLAVATLRRLDEAADLPVLIRGPKDLCDLLMVLGASPFLGDLFVREPSWLEWLFRGDELQKPSDEGIAALSFPAPDPAADKEVLLASLNSIKRQELLRIGARAVLGDSSMEEEFAALSDLADVLLNQMLSLFWPEEIPLPTVMALGKLGGRELNYLSDIDLILVLPLADSPDLISILPPATKAAERIVDALTRYTPEGSLYRVDLRLRPGGTRAPLIRTLRWMESYYAAQGAPWERQMMVKARICAGDRQGGEMLLNILQPFVYPAHAERDPGEEAHRLRRERRAREGTTLAADHVKLAPGAIRDVEFIVQVLQLLYGGRSPEVRHPTTLSAIEKLNHAGLLPDSEASDLRDAYLFMRRLEHFLQMQEDRQTFTLPETSHRRRAIARLMGFEDIESLLGTYNRFRESVLEALNSLLPGAGEEDTGEPVESLLNLPPGGEEATRRLRERGFARPEQSHRVLLAAGSGIRASGRNAWAAFVGLLPLLLEDAVTTGAPDRAVNNLERIMRRLGSPGAYASLLAREAPLRKALLTLCASGGLLTDLLLRHPEHFERLFSVGAAGSGAERARWRQRLRQVRHRVDSSREMVVDLESLKTREFLASGLAYSMGERDIEETMNNLGLLALDLIRSFLGVHFQEFINPPHVGVLSLGTLSARFMTFSSDADLLFIHSKGSGAVIQTLAARLAGLLSPPGGPYPVDMRLRPEGRSAPTSVDTDYLRSYLFERASPWEALALSRVRPLYGRKSMLDGALEVIEEWLEAFRLDENARVSLRGVRQRQEEELSKDAVAQREGEKFFDVKRSAGSLSDIEYLALGLTLDRWRRPQPRPAHITDLIPPLVKEGVLSPEEGELLAGTYKRMRKIQVGLQLHYGRDVTRLPASWPHGSSPVSLKGETAITIADDAARIRNIFDREYPVSRT